MKCSRTLTFLYPGPVAIRSLVGALVNHGLTGHYRLNSSVSR